MNSTQVVSDATSVGATGLFEDIFSGPQIVPIVMQWLSARTTWWFFTRTHDHDVTLTVGEQYWGQMTYTSKGYDKMA
ncbi:hypothetical protein BGZ96_004737 [Linnemannia gamsii]|uniref:Uncharacterized protein n=1 Tax=Linnemannia gamsii TaxID=64522 RepID=A0ABQ7KHE3_9FUNG|nr:hypothetical protein BGZ96_004737 [Linnemannia gamsii]